MSKRNIHLISASAGSGKTYELMNRLYDEVTNNNISPSSILATTFTKKAANELISRTQQKLISEGKPDLAREMTAARIGTVHSVCGRILKNFAFELALSPELAVIDEVEAGRLFTQAMLAATNAEQAQRLDDLLKKFGIDDKNINSDIEALCKTARQNNIGPDELLKFIKPSQAQIDAFLDKEGREGVEDNLYRELENYRNSYPESPDKHKNTGGVHKLVMALAIKASQGRLTWQDWNKFSNLKPAKGSIPIYEPIQEAAGLIRYSKKLRQDYSDLIEICFQIASESLKAYDQVKRELGVMDFGDQEQKTLQLLSDPENLKKLEGEVDLLFVDEFQDSNPIQLAIFLKLSEIAKKSVWVGDPKQSIFGFQGADPELMLSVIRDIAKGGHDDPLQNSYRSTPELVGMASELFTAAFAQDGIKQENVKLTSKAKVKSQLDPFACWELSDGKKPDRSQALSFRIKQLLNSKTQIFDKATEKHRSIRPSDIAILVKTNSYAEELSAALESFNLKTSVKKTALLEYPEVSACVAGLRYALNERDTLSAAEISLFLGEDPNTLIAQTFDKDAVPSFNSRLETLKHLEVGDRSPYEILSKVIELLAIEPYLENFKDSKSMKGRINDLLVLCKKYEEQQEASQQPSTALGFLTEVDELVEGLEEKDALPDSEAITVITYHRSKGLEWPIVIMDHLTHSNFPSDIFGVRVQAAESFDASQPLKDRSVLYLPWALTSINDYGVRTKLGWLDTLIQTNAETLHLTKKANSERRRLLYVGLTRAREQVIFAIPSKERDKIPETFMGALTDEKGEMLIRLPHDEKSGLVVAGKTYDCKYELLAYDETKAEKIRENKNRFDLQWERRKYAPIEPAPFLINPSQVKPNEEEIAAWSAGEVIDLNAGISHYQDAEADKIGDALHLFFASSFNIQDPEQLSPMLKKILTHWDMTEVLKQDEVLSYSKAFQNEIQKRLANGVLSVETHVQAYIDGTHHQGEIDLLIETEDEIIVIDHKSGLCNPEALFESSKYYIPQMATYKKILQAAYPDKKISTWLHWTQVGRLVELKREPKRTDR